MDDLLVVKVLHPAPYLPGPAHHLRREDLDAGAYVVVQRPPSTELKDDAVARGLCTHTPGKQNNYANMVREFLHNTLSETLYGSG